MATPLCLDQETSPFRLSVPLAVGARVLTLKSLEPDIDT